ncbi:sugar kinase [Pseudocolwellia agarivorans]|uniref:sugar kinase n=1 Tax=Pseudocolwellia agarivorans TaxID=1911682 RepID=UPI001FEB5FC0|nr:sugar kinase [Pseudocolwellia agarivorans]
MLIIGECMLELRTDNNNCLVKSFAGDTYNTAVYAKRYFPEANIQYLSSVGKDGFSEEMLKVWKSEGIDSDFVKISQDKPIGIYSITTDDEGERSFSYWRDGSAATQLMQLVDVKQLTESSFDFVYLSGITLAIFSDEDKHKLMSLIDLLKSKGAKIVFDPNYRPRMWNSKEHAIHWLEEIYSRSDLVLPGLEDHSDLLDQNDRESVISYMKKFNVNEQVIKCGKDGVYAYDEANKEYHLPFTPAAKQIDSTAAGDSFAGTYLAARLKGEGIQDALVSAARVASIVVQHHGAIVDKKHF